MGPIKKFANATALIAVAFSFVLYVTAFEPFGVAEFAYVFAVPAIIACRFLCGKTDNFKTPKKDKKYLEQLEKFGLSTKEFEDKSDNLAQVKFGHKLWAWSTLAFSYIAWIAILIWLRHVYPPSGPTPCLLTFR